MTQIPQKPAVCLAPPMSPLILMAGGGVRGWGARDSDKPGCVQLRAGVSSSALLLIAVDNISCPLGGCVCYFSDGLTSKMAKPCQHGQRPWKFWTWDQTLIQN